MKNDEIIGMFAGRTIEAQQLSAMAWRCGLDEVFTLNGVRLEKLQARDENGVKVLPFAVAGRKNVEIRLLFSGGLLLGGVVSINGVEHGRKLPEQEEAATAK